MEDYIVIGSQNGGPFEVIDRCSWSERGFMAIQYRIAYGADWVIVTRRVTV